MTKRDGPPFTRFHPVATDHFRRVMPYAAKWNSSEPLHQIGGGPGADGVFGCVSHGGGLHEAELSEGVP